MTVCQQKFKNQRLQLLKGAVLGEMGTIHRVVHAQLQKTASSLNHRHVCSICLIVYS